MAELECHLSADVVVPDIAGWRLTSMPDFPDTAWIDIAPDWVCEIVSPYTQKYNRSTKIEIYAREQVSHYRIVDPVDRLIEVFALQDGLWMLEHTVKDNVTATLEPFDEVPFELSRLWV